MNESEHLEDELSSEVSTAKTGVSLAVSALTGNYIEAAMKLAAQPKESSRGLLFLLFCIFMIFVLLIYCIPVTVYEGLESVKNNWSSFSSELKEAWNRGMYAGGGNLWERWKQALKAGTKELQSQFFNRINQNASTEDKVSQNDLGVLFSKDDYKEVLVRKMNAAGEKLDARSREIYEAVSSSDVLQTAFRERFLQEYGQFQGYDDVSYDGVVVSWRTNSSYGRDAIRMMSLYTVMKQGSGEEYKVSGFMRWLGWKDNGTREFLLPIADTGHSISIKAWKGEFLPMYLEEEQRYEQKSRAENRYCAAIDLLLKVSMPNVSEAGRIETVEYMEIIETQEDTEVKMEEPVTQTLRILHVSYEFPIEISLRSNDELVYLCGLWQGSLNPGINRILEGVT